MHLPLAQAGGQATSKVSSVQNSCVGRAPHTMGWCKVSAEAQQGSQWWSQHCREEWPSRLRENLGTPDWLQLQLELQSQSGLLGLARRLSAVLHMLSDVQVVR
jgi:hypothetical protein